MTWITDHKEWLHLTDCQLLGQKGTGNKVWKNTALTINIASFSHITVLMDPCFFRFPPLALGQSYDCTSASGGNLRNVSKFDSNKRFSQYGLNIYIDRLAITYDRNISGFPWVTSSEISRLFPDQVPIYSDFLQHENVIFLFSQEFTWVTQKPKKKNHGNYLTKK